MYLGIDIGTSKSAAVIVDADGRLLADRSRLHDARSSAPAERSEQDAQKRVDHAWDVVTGLPAELRSRVRAVGVTGQMHGVVLLDEGGRPVSPLVTWQDRRCLEDAAWLEEINRGLARPLRTGFGCATLAWWARAEALPAGAASACTIQDLVVARLCGLKRPVTDASDAASWGLFDLRDLEWDRPAAGRLGIPDGLLPTALRCGARAGAVRADMSDRLGIPEGVPVAAAIGDNQASLLGTLERPDEEIALTLGTGGQVSVIAESAEALRFAEGCPSCEPRPYPGGRMILVGASLCGGAAWSWLANGILAWQDDLGLPAPDRDAVFRRLNELGLQSGESICVRPHFQGERHAPERRGSIEGLSLTNFRLGPLARGLATGILRNLRDMLPPAALSGRERIMASGNALRRNPLLQRKAEEVFGLPLRLLESREEAAAGAALLARNLD